MSQASIQTLVLFFLIAVGFAAGKLGMITETVGKGLSRLLVEFILPCLIVASMQRPLSPELRTEAFTVLGLSFGVYAAAFPLAFLLIRLLRLRGTTGGVHGFAAVFSNAAFMGYPVLEAFFGKDILFSATIYNIPFQLLAFSIGTMMIARGTGEKARLSPRSFVNTAGISSLLGLGLFLLDIALPGPLLRALNLLGDTTTPLSMILIGATLARAEIKRTLLDWKIYATTTYRLVLFPAIVFCVLSALELEGRHLGLPVVIAAMPAAANSSILAEAYDGDSSSASALVFVSTALSLFTIPLMASLLLGL